MRASTHLSSVKCLQARICCATLPIAGGVVAKRKDSYAVEFARKGGEARAKKLTEEQRTESARKAAKARWSKKKGLKGQTG